MGLVVGDPGALGAIRMNWRTADPELLAALKDAVLADGTEREFLAFLNTLEPDEALDAGGAEDRPGRTAGGGFRGATSGWRTTGRYRWRCRTGSSRRRTP
jgi:hypothetical protein